VPGPARLLAPFTVALTVSATAVGAIAHAANAGLPAAAGVSDWWLMGVSGALAFGLPGGWLAWSRPRLPIGWTFLTMGALAATALVCSEYGLRALGSGSGTGSGAGPALWLGNWVWVVAVVPIASVVPLLLPDGRLPPARWRPALVVGLLSVLAAGASFALAPYSSTTPALAEAGLANPVQVEWVTRPAVAIAMTLLTVAGPLLGVVAVVARWRRARGTERQQLKWVLLGVGAAVALFAAGFVLGPTVTSLAMVPLPAAVVVAVLRYGLGDVDVVVSRSLVYGALTVSLLAVYVLVVGLLGSSLGRLFGNDSAAPVVATALVAVAAEPLHRRLRAGVNRLVHGSVEDPLTALSRLGDRLGAVEDPVVVGDQLLPRLVDSVATSLHLPYVAVRLEDGTCVEHGEPAEVAEELALTYAGGRVGTLSVATGGGPLRRGARSRLDRLAVQLGVAAHSVLLAHHLQCSREEAVGAREEERRRLYRDLHDGLGPSLAALALNVEVARETLDTDPARTAALLDRALPALQATVAEVRSVVHGLRPPALDDLGLIGAVRELAGAFGGPRLEVRIEADGDMDGLPAATEVATYRIVAEALTNASRHADASEVLLTLRREGDRVLVSVQDDGCGVAADSVPGVGIASMASRAEEVGGSLGVVAGPRGRGTVVRAVLPAVAL
jgi:signal transduction histidine kinase